MIQLIKNVKVYRDGEWKLSEILVADKKIEKIADHIDCRFEDMVVIDGEGMTAIPGYIDQHVHVCGGGGEGSFITQVPPLKFSEPVKAGVTTIVGLLGTDGTTRSVESLVAKAKAFREQGLTCYCLTGAYQYPSPNVTGSVRRDIVMLEECIGVKIAICDHRSATITRDELIRLASDAHQAGVLSGKPGIVHLHTGSGKDQLNIIFEALEHSEVPIATFRPTHVAGKIDQAIKFANMGGFIDITCDPDNMAKRCALIHRAMIECPEGSVTLSTDGNGSLPVWNEKKEMIGIGAGKVISLHNTIKGLVEYEQLPLEEAITIATKNPAKALGLEGKKGTLTPGADADILLLDENLNIDTTIALGRVLLQDGKMQVFCNFEDC
ncbi:MAG: beta-aspartyl-peptidase [Clostridia bacterium]|nr:beta-aspartyl-peptidase [Clostridia bacterium]